LGKAFEEIRSRGTSSEASLVDQGTAASPRIVHLSHQGVTTESIKDSMVQCSSHRHKNWIDFSSCILKEEPNFGWPHQVCS